MSQRRHSYPVQHPSWPCTLGTVDFNGRGRLKLTERAAARMLLLPTSVDRVRRKPSEHQGPCGQHVMPCVVVVRLCGHKRDRITSKSDSRVHCRENLSVRATRVTHCNGVKTGGFAALACQLLHNNNEICIFPQDTINQAICGVSCRV